MGLWPGIHGKVNTTRGGASGSAVEAPGRRPGGHQGLASRRYLSPPGREGLERAGSGGWKGGCGPTPSASSEEAVPRGRALRRRNPLIPVPNALNPFVRADPVLTNASSDLRFRDLPNCRCTPAWCVRVGARGPFLKAVRGFPSHVALLQEFRAVQAGRRVDGSRWSRGGAIGAWGRGGLGRGGALAR